MIVIRIFGIGMMAVVELHYVKAAAIHIEVNISLLKIWRDSFTDVHFRMQLFHFTPCRKADTLTMHSGRHEQQLKITTFTVHLYYRTKRSPLCHALSYGYGVRICCPFFRGSL